ILDEPNLVLYPGNDNTLEPGECRRAPVRSVRAAVTPCHRQTADVPLGAVVVRRYRRVMQEGEQFVTPLVQPLPDLHAVGMTRVGPQHQVIEPIDLPPAGFPSTNWCLPWFPARASVSTPGRSSRKSRSGSVTGRRSCSPATSRAAYESAIFTAFS